jgi:hypothetical protein
MCLDWLSAEDSNENASWDMVKTDRVIFFEQSLQAKYTFAEKDDRALDGTAYFGMIQVSSQSLEHSAGTRTRTYRETMSVTRLVETRPAASNLTHLGYSTIWPYQAQVLSISKPSNHSYMNRTCSKQEGLLMFMQ